MSPNYHPPIVLTPEQTAACRALYIRNLTVAFIEGDHMTWNSASEEERDEVRELVQLAPDGALDSPLDDDAPQGQEAVTTESDESELAGIFQAPKPEKSKSQESK